LSIDQASTNVEPIGKSRPRILLQCPALPSIHRPLHDRFDSEGPPPYSEISRSIITAITLHKRDWKSLQPRTLQTLSELSISLTHTQENTMQSCKGYNNGSSSLLQVTGNQCSSHMHLAAMHRRRHSSNMRARTHTHTLTLSRRRLLIKSELRPWTMVLAAAAATAFFALSFACIELADGLDITPIVFICSYCS
jgi:hypothetical protein